jgi:aminopeptidase N
VLRKQKLNVAFYDNDFKVHVIKDIIISDKNALNQVEFEFQGPVSAIIINFDEHAYAKIRFDQKTLDNLEKNLYKINDYVARGMVWRQIWIHVIDCKMSSLQYINFIINQLPLETIEQVFTFTIMNLSSLIAYYIPTDQVKP